MGNIDSAMASSKDMFTNCLAKAVNMFPGSETADREKMIGGLGDIGDLNINDGRLLDLKGKIVALETK